MPKIKEELTEEDESRRQRRRERNKVAATKCRNKKKAKTVNLMKVMTLPNNLTATLLWTFQNMIFKTLRMTE